MLCEGFCLFGMANDGEPYEVDLSDDRCHLFYRRNHVASRIAIGACRPEPASSSHGTK
jgi:hypothetical protein